MTSVDQLNIGDVQDTQDLELVKEAIEHEKESCQLMKKIAEMDTAPTLEDQTASFENLPPVFLGISTTTFGNTRDNPFFKLKEKVMNIYTSFEDRTQGLRYMQRIPHIKREKNCIECSITILCDEKYPIRDRYKFFANNDKYVKLDYDIVNACHKYFFNNFEKFKAPLEYKILSAQYLINQHVETIDDIERIQGFLINIAKDVSEQINYRAECADILSRSGYNNGKDIGNEVIRELGSLYDVNKKTTIYSNLENVHDATITKQLLDSLNSLIQTVESTKHAGEIYEDIVELTKNDDRSHIICESFQRVLIDTAKYEDLTMCDIMCLVWEKIITSSSKQELQKRFLDELFEMYQTCSSGHLSRLLNVLSGFFDDITPVKISYAQQLRSNIFAHYTLSLKSLSHELQEDIVKEMTLNEKPTIHEFIFSYSPQRDLQEEFSNFMSREEYNEVYKKAEKDYFGIVE